MNRVRWKLTLAYDGLEFFGWQSQPDCRTVQGELERALSRFSKSTVDVTGQGRTDRGVHALGQVAHADLPEWVTEESLTGAMRSFLPKDLQLQQAVIVHPEFHARFDAVSRRYRYQITTSSDLLNRRQLWQVRHAPDLSLLQSYSSTLPGEHDFSSVARMDPDLAGRSTRCTIYSATWSEIEGRFYFEIEGNRFLRHLVRRLVGTMIRFETAKRPVEEWKMCLESGTFDAQIHTAPAHALLLLNVLYP